MRSAFERVVEEYGPMVLRVCRAVVGPDLAEDAWSETFLAALRAFPCLPVDANVEAWLVTIAHRKAIDQFRAKSRRATPTEHLAEMAGASDGGYPSEHSGLFAAIAELPEKQRYCLAYHHIVGLSYDEVAEILGGTAAAARRAAADGVKTLRRTSASVLAAEQLAGE